MRIVIESNDGKQAASNDVVVINAGSAAPLIDAPAYQESSNPGSVAVDAGQPPSWLMTAIQELTVSSNESTDNPIDGGAARAEKPTLPFVEKVVAKASSVSDTSRFDYVIDAGAPTI
jgi:hypothetical protein